jgi:2-polyprenyl-6-methoxyphenol hydroxylase-like FAD-dependent oxidoreductase
LLAEVKAQGIPIVFNKKLVGLREGKEDVEIEFDDGTTVTSDFVIGADGVHSKIRSCIMDTDMTYSGFMGIIGMGLERQKMHQSITKVMLPNFIFGKTGFVAIMPSNYEGTEVDFFSTMPYPAHTREEWDALAKNKSELQSIFQQRFGKEWPQFVCNITTEYNKDGLGLFP